MALPASRRTLVLALDAFEPTVARELAAEGRMPAFKRLVERSARFDLDHPTLERYTGLAWHQFSTGLRPQVSGRWSAVRTFPGNYDVEQSQGHEPPFVANLGIRTVTFDVPHFNLAAAPDLLGVANWGCHDAAVPRATRPGELESEIAARFGEYPAQEHVYGIVWGDPGKTADMGRDLARAVDMRSEIARWLLSSRLPEWDLAIVAIGEFHSVIETMWHGWDETHLLHNAPSAPNARAALIAVYETGDRMIGELMDAFPDVTFLAFAPHGMGANNNDVAGMILMAELMYRYSFGRPAFMPGFALDPQSGTDEHYLDAWSNWVNGKLAFPKDEAPTRGWNPFHRDIAPARLKPNPELDWMPTALYRRDWSRMKAFAVPAYHDARIRVNLKGRERSGVIALADYRRTLDEIADIIRACAELPSGKPVDVEIEFTGPDDPMALNDWQTDIVVRYGHNTLGFLHPSLGPIGPVPHRRTGGHTGGYGIALVSGGAVVPGDYGVASTLDLAPAVIDLVLARQAQSPLVHAFQKRSV